MKKGIDISAYQPQVNWDVLKQNIDFTILRIGYGKSKNQKDKYFEQHYANCKRLKIPVGGYWYSYAMTDDEARQEARACIECIKDKQLDYPIYYDVEESKQFALGGAKVSSMIRAFCDEMEKAGYFVGLYTNYSSLCTHIADDIKTRYAIWLAHWNVSKSPYQGQYGVWQYAVGTIAGINGQVDLDYGYIDYPAIIKEKGLNNFKPENNDNVPHGTIQVEVRIDGITYNGTLERRD